MAEQQVNLGQAQSEAMMLVAQSKCFVLVTTDEENAKTCIAVGGVEGYRAAALLSATMDAVNRLMRELPPDMVRAVLLGELEKSMKRMDGGADAGND